MAGSTGVATITDETIGSVKCIKWDWVTGSSSQTDVVTGQSSAYYSGEVLYCVTVPDSTAIPDAAWDITITEKNSIDVLNGSGANRSTDATDTWSQTTDGYAFVPVTQSKVTLNVTNAGTEKRGLTYLYIR